MPAQRGRLAVLAVTKVAQLGVVITSGNAAEAAPNGESAGSSKRGSGGSPCSSSVSEYSSMRPLGVRKPSSTCLR